MVRLVVKSMELDDVFEDMVRVHLSHRPFAKAGSIVVVHANGQTIHAVARGAPSNDRECIFLDLATRERLSVKLNEKVDFEFRRADFLDEIMWAWNATNAMPRVAARLAALSVFLGFSGLMLGIVALVD